MVFDPKVISSGKKGGVQEVIGVFVQKENGEFQFNYSTAKDPQEHEFDLLKNFRNKFIDELERVNKLLAKFSQ